MVKLFEGRLMSLNRTLDKYQKGPLKGQFNRIRKYKVNNNNMTSQVQPMGTFHLLDDVRIKVAYPGNVNNFVKCRQFPSVCQGP